MALGVGLGRDVRVKNIRAARSKPGLRPQHVASLRVAAAVGGVSVAGGVGAVEITVCGSQATNHKPGRLRGGRRDRRKYDIDAPGVAARLFAATASIDDEVKAQGRNERALLAGSGSCAAGLGAEFETHGCQFGGELCQKRGFMPEGGGTLEATISSDGIKPIVLDATEASPERIDGVVFGRGDAESGNRLARHCQNSSAKRSPAASSSCAWTGRRP